MFDDGDLSEHLEKEEIEVEGKKREKKNKEKGGDKKYNLR
jgi:hypothetical protein